MSCEDNPSILSQDLAVYGWKLVMDKGKGNPWGLKGKGMEGKGKGWDFSTLEPFIPLKKICYVASTK